MIVTGGPGLPVREQDARHAVVACCGYESRGTYIAKHILSEADNRVCLDFESTDSEVYLANKEWFTRNDFRFIPSDAKATAALHDWVSGFLAQGEGKCVVHVDISSMSRTLLAACIEAVVAHKEDRCTLKLLYCPSRYVPRPKDVVPVVSSAPVSAFFAGTIRDSSEPISLIIGVGYEPNRALGCLDQFEASNAYAFRARGGELGFESDVDEANRDFFAVIGRDHILDYDVDDPMSAFYGLSSLVSGLGSASRVVIIPFGPKIFAAAALLVAIGEGRHAAVWRVSGEAFESPTERPPTDRFCHFSVSFAHSSHY